MKPDFDAHKPKIEQTPRKILQQISTAFGDSEVSLLHCFWSMRNLFGTPGLSYDLYQSIVQDIAQFRLFVFEPNNEQTMTYIKLTECGQNFLNCLIKDNKNNIAANKFSLSKNSLLADREKREVQGKIDFF